MPIRRELHPHRPRARGAIVNVPPKRTRKLHRLGARFLPHSFDRRHRFFSELMGEGQHAAGDCDRPAIPWSNMGGWPAHLRPPACLVICQPYYHSTDEQIRRVEDHLVRRVQAGQHLDAVAVVAADRDRHQLRSAVAHHATRSPSLRNSSVLAGITTEWVRPGA